MKKALRFLSFFPQVPGRVWVDLWGLAALIRFCLGKPVDPIYLGVLGIYGGTKIAGKLMEKKETDNV